MNGQNVTLTPQQFIEKMRRTFLVDDDLPEHLREGALNLQTQLNNALRLLSEDLYSKKSHFVLELVQNADDNSYRNGATPELTFHVTPDRLVLSNNEVGFSEENISAICKVGASSKAKDKQHHIGEKGIGFKSVFSVSNAPEIHSNGYHFRFDRTDQTNLLGYVVPSWCEPSAAARPDHTTIVLPAAPGYLFNEATLAGLEARILLFLNKLRQLTLVQGGRQHHYLRSDSGGLSRLTTSSTNADGATSEEDLRYVRVTKKFSMTGEYADVKRPGVDESTVVLAFPVDQAGEPRLEPSSYVFAYLPIQQMGFRFPLHADFILNSGREAVLNDRPWNQRLRDGIAETFAAAVGEFKRSPALGFGYLRFVPDVSDISDDFFGEVRQGIVKRLADNESLLSASGTWHRPSELRLPNKGFRALFSSAQALSLFGFDFVDTRVQASQSLLHELGVDSAGCAEILDLFRSHQTWLAEQPLEWRARLYAYIAEDLEAFIKAGLLKVPCLPTAEGTYVTPSQTNVFFPLGRGKKYGFEHELVIVNSELYDAALELSTDVAALFKVMGVRPDDPYDLVAAHILPKHAGESWKQSKFPALVGHLRYVKDKLDTFLSEAAAHGKTSSQAFQMLREGMWIGTKLVSESGWRFDRVGGLYLGKEYKPQFCIETLASGEPGPSAYVSADYLAQKPNDPDAEAKSWREFFEALGVRAYPTLDSSGSDWRCSKELDLLLSAPEAATRRETIEWLSQHWQYYAGKLTHAISAGRTRVSTVDSTFSRQIRSMVPPLRGKRGVVQLSESYYMTEEIHAALGDGPPYVDAILAPQMLDDCRVTHRLNAKALVKRLKQLKQDDAGTTKQVQTIYRALEGRLWETDSSYIRQALEDDGLIQLKGPHKGWFSPSEVSWQSNGPFLDSLYPPVQSLYRDFQGFFIEKLGVPRSLPLSKWVGALTRLGEISDRATRETEALFIYKRAERALRPQFGREIELPDWIATFTDEAVFVDHWGEVVANGDYLYANDSPEHADLFKGEDDLSLLAVPLAEVPRLSRLLTASGVARLSESVTVEAEGANNGKVDNDLTSRIQRSIPYISRVVYSRQSEAFDDAMEAGRVTALWNLTVVEVDAVNLRVTLGDFSRSTTADAAMADGRVLYRTSAKSLKDRVAAELSKYLVGTVDFADTFARILLEDNTEGIEEFLRVRSIGHLPPDLARAVLQQELPIYSEVGEIADEARSEGDATDDSDEAAPSEINEGRDNVPSIKPAPEPPVEIFPSSTTPQPIAPSLAPTRPPASPPPGASSSEYAPSPGQSDAPNGRPTASSAPAPSRGSSASRFPLPRTKSGRLLSYVEGLADAEGAGQGDDPGKATERDATGKAAVAYFLKTQATRWISLTEMPHNNPGFDVLAQNAAGEDEYIEVKGQTGAWTQEGIALTPTELLTAQRMDERYWLCIVEFAHDDKRRQLHLLRNPFGLVKQFRFDVGWKAAAENVATAPAVPEKGLYIDIAEIGVGRILNVRGKGAFFHMHVVLKDGEEINTLFHPGKMTLSKDPLWQE